MHFIQWNHGFPFFFFLDRNKHEHGYRAQKHQHIVRAKDCGARTVDGAHKFKAKYIEKEMRSAAIQLAHLYLWSKFQNRIRLMSRAQWWNRKASQRDKARGRKQQIHCLFGFPFNLESKIVGIIILRFFNAFFHLIEQKFEKIIILWNRRGIIFRGTTWHSMTSLMLVVVAIVTNRGEKKYDK